MSRSSAAPVATMLAPAVERVLGPELPIAVEFWDGSLLGPPSSRSRLIFKSSRAVRRILYRPGELGLARAYVAGELDLEGDIFEVLALRNLLGRPSDAVSLAFGARSWLTLLRVARPAGAVGLPLRPPLEEARLRGLLHSKKRDAQAIAHHYDLSNDFYRLVLGETMTYSCAYFAAPYLSLDEAQEAKYELISRKLGLKPGMRLLDIGCGWGGMALHAARRHGVAAVGITISRAQADLAEKRVAEAGLADRVEIRCQDYRDVSDGPYDAVSSIGMFEHVGLAMLSRYFEKVMSLLQPEGRFLNHAISRPSGAASFDKDSFIARYVFPDGELHEVGRIITAMQELGFEVRDVESLREHYARTLRLWVANLESRWDEAHDLVPAARARGWRLYMAASAVGFDTRRISVHQTLAVKPGPGGRSGMPPTRTELIFPSPTGAL